LFQEETVDLAREGEMEEEDLMDQMVQMAPMDLMVLVGLDLEVVVQDLLVQEETIINKETIKVMHKVKAKDNSNTEIMVETDNITQIIQVTEQLVIIKQVK
jgi:hypothetical protein